MGVSRQEGRRLFREEPEPLSDQGMVPAQQVGAQQGPRDVLLG